MRIGLITPGFSASEEDWCIPALLTLVRALTRKQHEVEIFTLRYPSRRGTFSVYDATVHSFGGGLTRGIARLPLLSKALAHVMRRHRHRPFDVLHGLWADEPGYLAVAAGRILTVPAVVSLMGGELVSLPDIGYGAQLSRAGRYMIRRALQGAARVTGGSTYMCTMAQQIVDDGRLSLLPLGVDGDLFSPEAWPVEHSLMVGSDINLLHVASLVPVKDQATLLKAFATVLRTRPNIHLHIVGQGPLAPDLGSLALTEGVATQMTLHGEVSHEQLPAYYRAADLCVLSSRFESQSMVALEGAACGRATIGTRVGILPDLYGDRWTVPVGDPAALAITIVAALSDPGLLAHLGRVALQSVQEHYMLEQTVTNQEALYAEVTAVSRS